MGFCSLVGAGEFLNLNDHERQRVMEIAVEQVRQRVPVIIGVLSPDTRHVCTVARIAKQAGADAVMVLPPYYATPSLSAIREHYRRSGRPGRDLSIVVYNNPARTNVNLDVADIAQSGGDRASCSGQGLRPKPSELFLKSSVRWETESRFSLVRTTSRFQP